MVDKVVGINSKKSNKDLIDTLKFLLEEAESGELDCMIYVGRTVRGLIDYGWGGNPCENMASKAEVMKFDILFNTLVPIELED